MGEDHIHESLDDDEQTNHEEVDDLQENVDYQSDLAITTSSEDVFKHIHYVKVLKNILQNSNHHLMLACMEGGVLENLLFFICWERKIKKKPIC